MFWSDRPEIARWATPRQLRRSGLFASQGLILGEHRRRRLCDNGTAHALLVATTGAGKTTCFAYPNLLTWRESVCIFDPAEELYPDTAGWRRQFSWVVKLSPMSSAAQRYNLLDSIPLGTDGEVEAVQLLSDAMTDPSGTGADKRSGANEHFTAMARKALQALLLYGLHTQRATSLGAMLPLLMSRPSFQDHLRAWSRYPHRVIREAAWAVSQAGEQDERGGIITTLSRALELYADPRIQRATDTSDFTLHDLRERARPMTLYLSIPPGQQERLRPWLRIVLRQLLDYTTAKLDGWRWKLWYFFDEFQTLGRVLTVSQMLNYARKFGVRFILITPSMEALVDAFGIHHPFFEACALKLAYGIEDPKVARLLSQRLGETEVQRWKPLGRGRGVWEKVREPLLSETALLNQPPQQAVVIAGTRKVLARKTYYKDDPVLLRRSLCS